MPETGKRTRAVFCRCRLAELDEAGGERAPTGSITGGRSGSSIRQTPIAVAIAASFATVAVHQCAARAEE